MDLKKLRKVLRIREMAERDAAQALAARQAQCAEAQATYDELGKLMAHYREQHRSRQSTRSHLMSQFLRFYDQMESAAQVQREQLQHLQAVEAAARAEYLTSYRERIALERLLEERDRVHRNERERAARRNMIRRVGQSLV